MNVYDSSVFCACSAVTWFGHPCSLHLPPLTVLLTVMIPSFFFSLLAACYFILQMMNAGGVRVFGGWLHDTIVCLFLLSPQDIFYSHRSFQRPHLQAHPHHSFEEEVRTHALSSQAFPLSICDCLQCAFISAYCKHLKSNRGKVWK